MREKLVLFKAVGPQSSRWQAISAIPKQKFEEHISETIAETIADEKELTSASLLAIAKEIKIQLRQDERRRKISEAKTISSQESGIFCSDCVAYMKNMETETVDLTVTSPPYGSQSTVKCCINGKMGRNSNTTRAGELLRDMATDGGDSGN